MYTAPFHTTGLPNADAPSLESRTVVHSGVPSASDNAATAGAEVVASGT
jgi:hypothetical protein